ncbi:MAG TPA: hypothetical protein VEB40_01925, partial [Flavipsychrobacter sp.]|nr:hypothetical protein [Flavipsychrobacter sp.]
KATGFGTVISEEEKQQDSTANARFEKSQLIRAYPEYDWILELPLAGTSYKIRDIAYKNDDDGEKGRIPGISGERDACQDGINYTVNDVAGENPTGYNVGTGTATEIKIMK